MSEFLYHKACPNCGSRDNLGVYTDHEYCFGCGYTTGTSRRTLHTSKPQQQQHIVVLPEDVEPYIPAVAQHWLQQYGLTIHELIEHRILWSDKRKLLIFPYFGEDKYQLLGWQGRYFGDDPKHPKWWTKGNVKEFIKVINLPKAMEHGIIYVEDIVSAIKLGRNYGACPVFGSFIPRTHSIRLHRMGVPRFYVWLDADKHREAHKFCKEIVNLGLPASVIYTDKDPKEYNDEELRNYLTKD